LPSADEGALLLFTAETAIFAALGFDVPACGADEDICVYMYNGSGLLQKLRDHANQWLGSNRAGFGKDGIRRAPLDRKIKR